MFEKKEAHHLPSHMGGPSLHPVIWEKNAHYLPSYIREDGWIPPLM
jgi:hypothetical protein